jgi:spore coat polysaccharide biosynthesis predicted glycosyltransferase SpsG
MILLRADTGADGSEGFFRLLYLAQLLNRRHPVCFLVSAEKTAAKILRERKIPFLSPQEEIRWEETTAILFDLPVFSSRDLHLLTEAKKRAVPMVQFTEAGTAPLGTDLTIDFTAQPAIIPLHQRFRHFQRLERKYRRRVRRIFLGLGDAVDYRQLKEVVDLLRRARFQIQVAPFSAFKKSHAKALRRLARGTPGIRFVGKPDSLARPLFEADVAVILSGQRAYEAAACGTPALYFAATPGQKKVAEQFAAAGAGIFAGEISSIPDGKWLETISSLTFENRLEMGQKGKALIDGLGVHRVLALLKENKIIG